MRARQTVGRVSESRVINFASFRKKKEKKNRERRRTSSAVPPIHLHLSISIVYTRTWILTWVESIYKRILPFTLYSRCVYCSVSIRGARASTSFVSVHVSGFPFVDLLLIWLFRSDLCRVEVNFWRFVERDLAQSYRASGAPCTQYVREHAYNRRQCASRWYTRTTPRSN